MSMQAGMGSHGRHVHMGNMAVRGIGNMGTTGDIGITGDMDTTGDMGTTDNMGIPVHRVHG